MQSVACGLERFSPPDFESAHQLPQPTTPEPRESVLEYVDVAVLFGALLLTSYLVLKRRSRKLIFVLMIFSIAYFGFWRAGCICPIGSIQNAVFTIFDADYAASITVILFLLVPLAFTLFFGRMFCASVCPLGAIQDVFLLKPLRVPPWLESSLRLLAYVYLGLAVLFAATGAAFVICRYDPFIGFFRLSATFNMLIVGMCFLVVGIFIGRPYCRFFCPYGILLRHISRLSKWRVTITPDECINCRLCQDACPFGAIESPTAQWGRQDYDKGRKRLALALGALPVLIFLGSWGVSLTAGAMSRVHPTVRLAERIHLEESGQVKDTTDASAAFRATGRSVEELYAETVSIQSSMRLGSWILGGFVGLVIGLKLIRHCVRRPRTDYEADRAQCLACGRCFEYGPRERLRLENISKKTPTMGNSSE